MPTIRIDNDVMTFLQSKAKPFIDSPNDVLRREFGLDKTSAKGGAPSIPTPNRQRFEPDKDYTHHPLVGFLLYGKPHVCFSFKDLLIKFCVEMRKQHQGDFDKVALTLHGTKRRYFSLEPKRLKFPVQLIGTNLYAETNLNANLIVGICQNLIIALGHDQKDFAVEP